MRLQVAALSRVQYRPEQENRCGSNRATFKMSWIRNPVLFLISVLFIQALVGEAIASADACKTIFSERRESYPQALQRKKQIEVLKAGLQLLKYRNSVSKQILERDFILDPFLVALLAREHILLIGPPGNAKTNLSKVLLSNIVDRFTGASSFYSMQMNKEITLSDTHGSVNFKALSDEGTVRRNYEEGLLGARYGFIDESFDIRPGALRNLLDILAERAHSQGTKQHKGLTEVVVAATNKTLPEVYEEFNNSEAPRALVDRFAFVFLVPKEMESIKSDRQIFRSARSYDAQTEKLTFQDIEVLRGLIDHVEIPDYVADLASLIHYYLGPLFEAKEVKSLEQYREKIQNAEHTLPPFRASKYMSPRTLGKAGNILKAIVVLNYVKAGGNRSLTATTKDLDQLRAFYHMNGASAEFLNKQLNRALKEYEKEQIKVVQLEREIADRVFDDVLKGFNESIASLRLPEIDERVRTYASQDKYERRKLVDLIRNVYLQGLAEQAKTDKDEINPESIAFQASVDLMRDFAERLFGTQTETVLRRWENESGLDLKLISARKARKAQYRYGFGDQSQRTKGRLPRDIALPEVISEAQVSEAGLTESNALAKSPEVASPESKTAGEGASESTIQAPQTDLAQLTAPTERQDTTPEKSQIDSQSDTNESPSDASSVNAAPGIGNVDPPNPVSSGWPHTKAAPASTATSANAKPLDWSKVVYRQVDTLAATIGNSTHLAAARGWDYSPIENKFFFYGAGFLGATQKFVSYDFRRGYYTIDKSQTFWSPPDFFLTVGPILVWSLDQPGRRDQLFTMDSQWVSTASLLHGHPVTGLQSDPVLSDHFYVFHSNGYSQFKVQGGVAPRLERTKEVNIVGSSFKGRMLNNDQAVIVTSQYVRVFQGEVLIYEKSHSFYNLDAIRILTFPSGNFAVYEPGQNKGIGVFYQKSSPLEVWNTFDLPAALRETVQSPDQKLFALVYPYRIDVFTADELESLLLHGSSVWTFTARTLELKNQSTSNMLISARIANDGRVIGRSTEGFTVFDPEEK